MKRRDILSTSAALTTLAVVPSLFAQTAASSQPIRLIVPFQAGGSSDALGRVIAKKMKPVWPQTVVVENRPGAGGVVAVQALLAAPRDGNTLLLNVVQTILRPILFPQTAYNVQADLAPLTRIGNSQITFVVRSDLPVNNMREFVAYANAPGRSPNFGASGAGSVGHLYAEMIKKNHVPSMVIAQLRGDPQIMSDLLGGHITCSLMALPSISQHVSAGKIKVLAITGTSRSAVLPNVPTFIESGFPDMDTGFWFALFAASGTPASRLERLHADLVATLGKDKEFLDWLDALGTVQEWSKPADFANDLRKESAKWASFVAASGVKVEQ